MSEQNFDFKLEVFGVDLRTEISQLIATSMSSDFTFDQDIAHAEELARRWNLFPDLERRNRELVTKLEEIQLLVGYLTIHGVDPVSPDSDGPQKVPVGKTELKEILNKIGELARQALTERSGQ